MNHNPSTWVVRDRVLTTQDHTLVMGIVNVTPDSFSDGGSLAGPEAAVTHGLELWREGADIVDVGGESTRPGAAPVEPAEEIHRIVPVVERLVDEGVVVSVDTRHAGVAAAAIDVGAHIVNDVSSFADPGMAEVCADSGVGVVLMHMRGDPETMQSDPRYDDVVAEVAAYLEQRALAAEKAGVARARICIDPGIGFGKTFQHNLDLLRNVDWLVTSGYPVLIGSSRKRFLGSILESSGIDTAPADRDPATGATVALAIAGGASVVRVHNVGHGHQVARVADAIVRAPQRRT